MTRRGRAIFKSEGLGLKLRLNHMRESLLNMINEEIITKRRVH